MKRGYLFKADKICAKSTQGRTVTAAKSSVNPEYGLEGQNQRKINFSRLVLVNLM
jgi:hypothetical protein